MKIEIVYRTLLDRLDCFKCETVHPNMYYLMNDKAETMDRQPPNQWAEIIGQLFDKLVGKNVAMTYNFDNLTIDLPKAEGPNGQFIGSAKWTINGKVIITTETFKKDGFAAES